MQRILLLNVDTIKNNIPEFISKLKLDELALEKKKDKDLYIATRLIENYVLNGREKHVSNEGKPYAIKGSRYNLSQVGEYACAIESDIECGIDIAKEQVFTPHFKDRLFSEKDNLSLETDLDILRAWTIKEACVKCNGVGLKGIFNVHILSEDKCELDGDMYFYKSFFFDSYCISAVQKDKIDIEEIQELQLTDLFIYK